MKHRQDKDFRGGGHPYKELLRGAKLSEYLKNVYEGLKRSISSNLLSAFSLGDVLVAIAIIGALAVILIPIYRTVNPDKEEAMHKKATFIVERIVNELSTDEYLYPNNGEYSGFSNTDKVTQNGVEHVGSTKFCSLFISRLNKLPNTETNCNSGVVNATSIEGMDWYLPISDFQNGPETLIVDVNSGEGPNELGKDQFEYQIQPGQKVPVKEVQYYAPPEAPDDHAMPEGDIDPTQNKKLPGLEEHSISCGNVTGATILGQGDGKVNGNYMLIAIPQKGYSCSWFTKQVTIKDGDVDNCEITCTEDLERPGCEQEPCSIVPEPVPEPEPEPEPGDDDDDTYCINVTVTGESDKCTVEGAGCEKAPGIYQVNVISTDPSKYSASWTQQSVTIEDKDVNLEVECSIGESCYNINLPENSNCDIVKPAGNCPSNGTKYLNGTHTLQVTPKEGFTYQGKTKADGATGFDVIVNGSDVTPNIVCESSTGDNTLTIAFSSSDVDFAKAKLWVTVDSETPDGTKDSEERTVMIYSGPGGASNSSILSFPANTKYTLHDIKTYTWWQQSVNEPEGQNGFAPADLDGKNLGLNAKIDGILDVSKIYNFTLHGDKPADLITLTAVTPLSTSEGSVSISGTTVTIDGGGDSPVVKNFKVTPSNTGKQWKLNKNGGITPSLSGGTGEKTLSVTVKEDGCMTASYTDGSATSGQICFKKTNTPKKTTLIVNVIPTSLCPTRVEKFNLNISGPTSISEAVTGSSYTNENMKAGSYTVGNGNAGIQYDGRAVYPTPITWDNTSFTLKEGDTYTLTGKVNYCEGSCCPEPEPEKRESIIRLSADLSSCCVSNAKVNYTVKSDKGFNKTGTLTPDDTSGAGTDITVPIGANYTITGSVSDYTCIQNGCTFSWKEFDPDKINIPMLNAKDSYPSKAVFGCSGCGGGNTCIAASNNTTVLLSTATNVSHAITIRPTFYLQEPLDEYVEFEVACMR